MDIENIALNSKKAAVLIGAAGTEVKNTAILKIAEAIERKKEQITEANNEDLKRSEKESIAAPLLKRLKFDNKKIIEAVEGLKSLATLEDPVGKIQMGRELDKELVLYRVSCPIGVIGVIFESRPDALVQISCLCLKSGNSVVLKGGSEAKETNNLLFNIIREATGALMPDGWISMLNTRDQVNELLKMDKYVDLIIPRGSNEFVRHIMSNSRIPVMGHADGICHCYVDKAAELSMAVNIVVDSKTQYAAVCNASETLLVHSDVAEQFLPLLKEVFDEKKVELYGCDKTRRIIKAGELNENSYKTEYLDYKMNIRVVESLDQAIEHINTYGSGHTDTIITNDKEAAYKFMQLVDSGNVFQNCSTRFSDGYRYGFGAEVGISTSKLHARGPVGLDGLVIYKYRLFGNGHIVEDYSSKKKTFIHRDL